MKESILQQKSFMFAKRIVKLNKHLVSAKKEFVLSKQLLRSGTSVGANICEAKYAQSDKDFISKLSIALKEAKEVEYWILLLKDDYLSNKESDSILHDAVEIIKLLTASIKTMKAKTNY